MIITLLRKPLEGTVAENTLKHGCGAINIDATRINTSDNLNGGAYAENPTERGGEGMWTSSREADSNCFRRGGAGDYEQPSGRWPANFILNHLEGCEIKGTKKIKSSSGRGSVKKQSSADKLGNQGPSYSKESRKEGTVMVCHVDEDGNEEVADWACVEGCPVKELDDLSLANGMHSAGSSRSAIRSSGKKGMFPMDGDGHRFGDEGGASRFFKQFKKGNDQ